MAVCWLGEKKNEDFRLAFIRTGNTETSPYLGCPWPGMWMWFCRSHGEAEGSLWAESHSAPHTDNTPDTPIGVLQGEESFPYISVKPSLVQRDASSPYSNEQVCKFVIFQPIDFSLAETRHFSLESSSFHCLKQHHFLQARSRQSHHQQKFTFT